MTLKKLLSLPVVSKYNDALFFLTLCVTLSTFTFSVALNIITLAGYSFCFMVDYRNIKKHTHTYFTTSRCILLLIIFCSLLISWVYSNDKANAFHELIKFTPFVILPLTLLKINELSAFRIMLLKRLYILVCLLTVLICLVLAVYDSGLLDGSYKQHVTPDLYINYFAHLFTYHQLSEHLYLHAIYLTLLLVVAVFFIFEELKNNIGNKILLSCLLGFFMIVMLMLKATSINFSFYSLLLVYLYLSLGFRKWTDYVLFLGLTVFASFAVSYLFTLKSIGKYTQVLYLFDSIETNARILLIMTAAFSTAIISIVIKLLFGKNYPFIMSGLIGIAAITGIIITPIAKNLQESFRTNSHVGVTNVNARFGTWTASVAIIRKHPLFGVGIGDETSELIKTYQEIGFKAGVESNFDTHNQYFQFWIDSGIISFLAFLLLLVSEFYKSVRDKNLILTGFIFCFSILCLSEVVMNAQLGRMSFLFFICTLGKLGNHKEKVKSVSKS